jgi:hypothetical protein
MRVVSPASKLLSVGLSGIVSARETRLCHTASPRFMLAGEEQLGEHNIAAALSHMVNLHIRIKMATSIFGRGISKTLELVHF